MNRKSLFKILAVGAVLALLLSALVPIAAFGSVPEGDDDIQPRPAPAGKRFPPKDQPDPEAYRRMRQREKAVLAGDQAQAQALQLTGEGKVLVLLVEFAGTDVTTWNPGDIWDPYGIVEVVDAEDLGDCTNVITETQEFTYSGPLHNEIPRPASAEDADYNFWTEDFGHDHYDALIFGDGLVVEYLAENGDPVTVDLTGVSMRLFYEEQSKGLYTVGGDIVGWIPVDHSEAFYGADLCPGNLSFVPISGAGSDGWFNNGEGEIGVDYGTPASLIWDAVDWINANIPDFDWAQYDDDGDGVVDHLFVIHAGQGEEEGGGPQGEHAIWSHSAGTNYCADPGPDEECGTEDDIRIGPYVMNPESGGVNVFAHEYGHQIGADDLYAYSYGEPSGDAWSIMGDSWGSGWPQGTMPQGFDPWHKLAWGWVDPVMLDLTSPETEIALGQASIPPEGTEDSIMILLPDQSEELASAHSGEYMWYGGRENLIDNKVYHAVDLTGYATAELSFWTQYDIETAWDFGFVQVSTDGGATWTSLENEDTTYEHDPQAIWYVVENLPGLTGSSHGWVEEAFDLTPYAGQEIMFQFRYATDWGSLELGWWVDDITITADGGVIFFDDVESGPGDWVADPVDGWSISNGVFTFSHYYMVEWRNDAGFDYALAIGRYRYQDWGMLVWYVNNKYVNNEIYNYLEDTPSFGPKGRCLVVDAHPMPPRDPTSVYAQNARANVSPRGTAMRDAAFGLRDLPPFQVLPYPGNPTRWGNPDIIYPSEPAVSAFHDVFGFYPGLEYANYRGVDDPRGPRYYWLAKATYASAVVPATADYGVALPWYDRSGFLTWIYEYPAWFGWWDFEAGTGNPGLNGYGVHLEIKEEAADLSQAQVRFYSAAPESATIQAAASDAGYLYSGEMLENHFGSAAMWTGLNPGGAGRGEYVGAFQFDLSDLPAGAKVVEATVEMPTWSTRYVTPDAGGEWTLQLLDSSVDLGWKGLGYWDIALVADVEETIGPFMTSDDLGDVNTLYVFTPAQRAALQERLGTTGKASFRIDYDPTLPIFKDIMGWGVPVLRVTYWVEP